MKGTLEQQKNWWNRIAYEIAPWSWSTDPYLVGDLCGGEPMDKETFDYLKNLETEPE